MYIIKFVHQRELMICATMLWASPASTDVFVLMQQIVIKRLGSYFTLMWTWNRKCTLRGAAYPSYTEHVFVVQA
jgi:hypothetical protein